MLTPDQSQFLGFLVEEARKRPDKRLQLTDASGATTAVLVAHDLPRRPQDMPRALRPKGRLSKRRRDAAKREKLDANRVAAPVG